MAKFFEAWPKVARHEGVLLDAHGRPVPGRTGYVNDPEDPGGETNWGITWQVARAAGYTGSMADMKYETALEIYRGRYWDALRADEIPDQAIATELFDTAVNCGVSVVSLFLQQALNVFNVRATKYPDIPEDGRVGPVTVGTLRRALAVASYYPVCLLRAVDNLQGVRYIELAKKKPKLERFLPGWYRNRVGVRD